MDERFRDKRLWIGAGGLAAILLCISMCGLSSLAMFTLRQGPAYAPVPYVQPPAVEDGGLPPPVYYGYGPSGMGRHFGFSPFGFILKLFLAGLGALLLFGLLRRTFWGHRNCSPHHWHAYHRKPPYAGKQPGAWGPPWAWHGQGQAHEAEAEPSAETGGEDHEAPYAGPQE